MPTEGARERLDQPYEARFDTASSLIEVLLLAEFEEARGEGGAVAYLEGEAQNIVRDIVYLLCSQYVRLVSLRSVDRNHIVRH